ncbi:MAG: YiiX/YebB-like N1pC/P60 family cysteine hydrolase [Alphaproteobacteria bacterium]|nr:YiiX/YebB-like N1pC/P60 family cysteine hydrolase [Alphaproteobacteria bacterium]
MNWLRQNLAWLLLFLALGACANGVEEGKSSLSDLSTCCANTERYPPVLVHTASIGAPILGRMAARVSFRPGYLSDQPEAQAYLVEQMQPLDIIIVRSRAKLTHRLIHGAFAHVAVYLGNEDDYRKLGLLDNPAVADHRTAIAAGETIIESDYRGVHLSPPSRVFRTDAVVVLRPKTVGTAERRRLILAFLSHVGTPFDFHFRTMDDRCLYCAELANHILPDLGVPLRSAYGRSIILPDDFIARTLEGRTNMRLLSFVQGDRNGWHIGTRDELISVINAAW